MKASEIKALDNEYVLHTYNRAPFVLDHGEGMTLYDTEGNAYLDFVSGIAVNALGHSDPDVTQAIVDQAAKLVHVSNLYQTIPQVSVAKMLVETSFAGKVFFCNSGTESVEAAIKFARKWARSTGQADKVEMIAFSGAFHGRTMGSLALTPRPHYQDPFLPLMPGAHIAEFNNIDSVKALISDKTCAVIIEPLQGEGGVHPADPQFMKELRALCDASGCLLIFDEVQCGVGRTGTLWGHEPYGVTPDIMTSAKPLGGGLPMGATLMTQAVADTIEPGDHASTFAANPVTCAAAEVVLSKVSDPAFLEHVRWAGSYLVEGLGDLAQKHDCIETVRGRGLIIGVQTNQAVAPVVQSCYDQGLLTLNAGPNVLRLLPPLVVQQEDMDKALAILDKGFEAIDA